MFVHENNLNKIHCTITPPSESCCSLAEQNLLLKDQKLIISQTFYRTLQEKLESYVASDDTPLKPLFLTEELSPFYLHYKRKKERKKSKAICSALKEFFESLFVRKIFEDNTISCEEFEKRIHILQLRHFKIDIFLRSIDQIDRKFYQKELRFFSKWRPYFIKEMKQGCDSPDKIFHSGVCLGFAQRVIYQSIQHPDFGKEAMIQALDVLPLDRYLQATASLNRLLFKVKERELCHLFKRENITGQTLFEILYPPFTTPLSSLLEFAKQKLNLDQGWIELDLYTLFGGHVILLRWDPYKNMFWLIDPNIGFLAFESSDGNREDAKIRLLECFQHLIKVFYPYTYKVKGLSFQKEKPIDV